MKKYLTALFMICVFIFTSNFASAYLTPSEMIEQLISQVISLNLHNGITNSLDSKLENARKALEDVNENNNVAAVNTIKNAFINEVEAQRGDKISESDADVLIAVAYVIINKLQYGACGFFNTFDSDMNGWIGQTGDWYLENGTFLGQSISGDNPEFAQAYYADIFTDFTYEATAKGSGITHPNYWDWGIIFRGDGDISDNPILRKAWNNLYIFQIANSWGEFRFGVQKRVGGTMTYSVPNQPSEYINPEWNTLKVVAQGNQFTCYINGHEVATFTDNSHVSGYVGIYSYTCGNWPTCNSPETWIETQVDVDYAELTCSE